MMRKWLFAAAMLLPGAAAALGLGKLDLNSALNEPFDARIQILSASVEELDSMKAGLASPEAFDRAGIPYGFGLSQLKFEIRETEEGPDYIRVYSTDAIREPFLNFLLEVNWSQGRLFREYTVLLDPPTYDPNRKRAELAPAPVQTPSTYGEVQAIGDNQVTYDLEYTPTTAPDVTPAISYSGGDYGPTSTGDTLWSIASAMRPDSSVSVQQMMIALLRANPEAFIGNNINGLKRGQILTMPDEAAINNISKTQAIELAKSQNNAWNDIRSGLADTVTDRPESPGVSATGADAAVIDEGMPEGDAELRLVAPDTTGEGIDEAMTEPGMDEETEQLLALANETIAALELENAELNDKLTESESIIEDLKRLIELKEDELAALQDQIASAAAMEEEATAEEEMPAEEVAEEAAPAEAEEMEAPESMAEEPVAEEDVAAAEPVPADAGIMGMVNQYLGPVIEIVKSNMLIIGGAVGGIIVLLVGFAGFRKWQSSRAETLDLPEADFPDFDDVTEAADDADTGSMIDVADSEAVTEIGDEDEDQEDKTPTPRVEEAAEATDDATQIVTPEAEAPAEPAAEEEDEDPLAEVNVFMAFDQFDQAIDFVKNAIEGDPDNLDFHTRLLEVYYAAGDRKGYEEHARVLHEKVNGQGPHWDMAVSMWSELSPNRALFEEGAEDEDETPVETGGGGVVDLTAGEEESAQESTASGLDFDIGADEDEGVLDVTAGGDIESTGEKAAESGDEEILDVTAAIDSGKSDEELLDVTAAVGLEDDTTADEKPAADAGEEDENVLDITGGGEDDQVLDITAGAEAPAAGEEDILDISAGAGPATPEEDEAEEDGLSGGDDLLDVTASANLTPDSDEDLLDVTSASTASADSDSLLDVDTGESEKPGADEDSGDDNALDFDMEGLDLDMSEDESEEESGSMIEQAMDSEDDNVIDFDSATAKDEDAEIEGTVEVDAATLGIESADEDTVDTDATPDVELDLTMDSGDDDDSESGGDLTMDMEIPDADADSDDGLSLDLGEDSDAGESESPDISLGLEADQAGETDLGLDLELETDEPAEPAPAPATDDEGVPEIDMESTVELPKGKVDSLTVDDDDDDEKTVFVPKAGSQQQSQEDEVSTKLDLAKAYVELGDSESAKTILDEIMQEGTEEQKQQAQELLDQV